MTLQTTFKNIRAKMFVRTVAQSYDRRWNGGELLFGEIGTGRLFD